MGPERNERFYGTRGRSEERCAARCWSETSIARNHDPTQRLAGPLLLEGPPEGVPAGPQRSCHGMAAVEDLQLSSANTPHMGEGDMTTLPRWARISDDGYEVSTKGDARFSALNARLKDGRTIEEAYQLDVKGFRARGLTWRQAKGRMPATISREELWHDYLALWWQWARENPALIEELRERARGKTLTDCFAWSEISQARALAEILQHWW